MSSTKTLIMSLNIILMSSGAIFIAILLSFALHSILTSVATETPAIVTTLKSWVRPPCLYFIINGIIITIVALSRLHHQNHHHAPSSQGELYAPPAKKAQLVYQHDVIAVHANHNNSFPQYDEVLDKDVEKRESEEMVVDKEVTSWTRKPLEYEIAAAAAEEVVIEEVLAVDDQTSMWSSLPAPPPLLTRQEAIERLPEFFPRRRLASSRFGHHRKQVKASLGEGGKSLRRVAKPKKHNDTLESTWKAITEGRHIPLTRHLKKPYTWENSGRQIDLLDSSPLHEVKKSQTFTDQSNYTPPRVPTKLKKEPSLGHDELNRRVEAFINKFNEDMRLQRQQSVQQFMEMINRAA